MSKAKPQTTYLAALDIGSTKVVFSIAQAKPSGIEIIGLGSVPHSGVKQGLVVNIESTSEAITKAKEEAELMAGTSVDQVWLGVGGSYIQSFQSSGMVAVSDKEVSQRDVDRVIEAAKAVAIPSDRSVLHVIPNFYKVDNQDGISDPLGMTGVRLEASVLIVTALKSSMQNSIRATEKAGLKVKGTVLQTLAASKAVLTDDEKDMGSSLIILGGSKTEIISFVGGSAIHTSVIPVGGIHFTQDVAMGLRTTQANAEVLKCKHAYALSQTIEGEETIEVESVGGRPSRTIDKKALCDIIEARSEETLGLVGSELNKNNLISLLGSGVVITGGGSQLNGLIDLADFIFDVPVRSGAPKKVGGLTDVVSSPHFSTTVGLLLYGRDQISEDILDEEDVLDNSKEDEETYSFDSIKELSNKVKKYFEKLF